MPSRELQQAELRRATLDAISCLANHHHQLPGVALDHISQNPSEHRPDHQQREVSSPSDHDNKSSLLATLADVETCHPSARATSGIDSRANDSWLRITSTFGHATDQLAAVAKMFAQNSIQVHNGPDLEEIQTEEIGFLALAGEEKVRFVPRPWPHNALPPPTASLLSIASRRGLVAAAGPDTLVVGSTSGLRDTLIRGGPSENNVRPFSAQLSIQIPRITQLAFSSDENFLTICAESGGGLAIYDVQSLAQGATNPSHQLATNGISVRALVPNPAEETAHVLALVLTNGQLMLADLKEKKFIDSRNGPILRESVSCVSWSARGKQLVAGLENGSSVQLKPDGSIVAEIPKPSDLQGEQHVSSIFWVNNDTFLLVHTASNFDLEHAPDSTFTLATRAKSSPSFMFQKLPDPCPPFGMNRSPPSHFMTRLRNFPPSLTEALIVASTASADIGLLTSSSIPLSRDSDPEKVINHFTSTSMANETRRAQLPVNEEMNETSPIGMALDLSSTELVRHPIPGDELESTSTPLPALMVLNNEGILSSWWFVFSESIRKGLAYPGLNIATNNQGAQPLTSAQPTFAQSSNAGDSRFSTPAQSSFANSSAPAFGATSTLGPNASTKPSPWNTSSSGGAVFGSSSFGSPSTLSQPRPFGATSSQGPSQVNESPFGRPAFGQPAFGSSTSLGGSGGFGSPGNVGNRASPWTAQTATSQSTLFGQQEKPANPFAASASTASPFAGLNSKGMGGGSAFQSSSFASLSEQTPPQSNVFGSGSGGPKPISQPSFGSTVTIGSSLGVTSSFGIPSTSDGKSSWLTPGASSKSDEHFGTTLPKASPSPEADMAMTNDDEPSQPLEDDTGTQGVKAEAPSLFSKPNFKFGSTFGGGETRNNHGIESDEKPLFGSAFGDALTSRTTDVSTLAKADQAGERQTSAVSEPGPSAIAVSSSQPQSAPASNPATPLKPEEIVSAVNPVHPADQSASGKLEQRVSNPSPISTPRATARDDLALPTSNTLEPPLPPSPTLSSSAATPKISEQSSALSTFNAGSKPEIPSGPQSKTPSRRKEDEAAEAPLPPDFIAQPTPTPQWAMPPLDASTVSTTPKADLPGSNAVKNKLQIPISAGKQSAALGTIEPPTLFPRPGTIQQSPRSPSPTRTIKPLRSPSPRLGQAAASNQISATHPRNTFGSNQLGGIDIGAGRPSFRPTTRSFTQPSSVPLNHPPQTMVRPEFEAAENTSDESELIRTELAAPVEPSRNLEPFLAYQDYVGQITGQGIPAQVERVYRDICSMIDTLGLNARALKAWTKGQQELIPDGGRERKNLDNEDDWCLTEVEDLAVIQRGIEEQLEADRICDVDVKISELSEINKDLLRQHAKYNEVKRLVQRRGNIDDSIVEPLSTEQSGLVVDLRNECTQLFARLAKAEDSISLLKVRISSRQAETFRGAQSVKTPTAEAVLSTINKMTAMFEKRNTDIDVLESQLRKLGVSNSSMHRSPRDRVFDVSERANGNPFSTPDKGIYALDYSSDSDKGTPNRRRMYISISPDRDAHTPLRSSLTSTQRGKQTQPEIEVYRKAQRRRHGVLNALKDKVIASGVRTTKVQ